MARARFASTVVLLRTGANGRFEILLTRRPPQMRFLGGFYVFPGGALHDSDYAQRTLQRCRGLSAGNARKLLGSRHDPELALAHWVAAARELFEEVGVLLCVTSSGEEIDFGAPAARERIELKRRAVVREELDFGAFLESEELYCDLSRCVYFFHRVTPEFYPLRFDTRFYLALLPPNQSPLLRSEEVADSLWIHPDEALARISSRDFPLLPPTTTVLENLARLPSWERLRAHYPGLFMAK